MPRGDLRVHAVPDPHLPWCVGHVGGEERRQREGLVTCCLSLAAHRTYGSCRVGIYAFMLDKFGNKKDPKTGTFFFITLQPRVE